MMINSHFTLKQDIVERLKSVKNKSALINSLLEQYFMSSAGDVGLIQQKKEKIMQEVSIKAEEVRLLESKEAELVSMANTEEQQQAENIEKKRQNLMNLQKRFREDIGREITQGEFANYLELLDAGEVNYWEFMEKLKNG